MRRAIAFALTGVLLVGYPAAALAEGAEQDTRTEALQVAQEGDATTDPGTPADSPNQGGDDSNSDSDSSTGGGAASEPTPGTPADSPKQGGDGSNSSTGGSTDSALTQQSLATTGDPTSPLLVVGMALGGVAIAAIGAATKVRGATERG